MVNPRFMAGFTSIETGMPPGPYYQKAILEGPTEIRIGYVHLDALCWTFFRYHLLIKASQRGITVLDRPVSTLKEQIAEINSLLREASGFMREVVPDIRDPCAVDRAWRKASASRAAVQ